MKYSIEVVDEETGIIIERIMTNSYLVAYEERDQIKVIGNLMKQLVLGQAGSFIREFASRIGGRKG